MSGYGFACLWDEPRSPTWSYISLSLLRALETKVDITDLGPDPGGLTRGALKLSNARWTRQGRVSVWRSSSSAHRYVSRALDRRCREISPDAIVEVPGLWRAPVPYFAYRDVSWDQLRTLVDDGYDLPTLGHPGFTRGRLDAVRSRENVLLHEAAGAIVFSRWAARHLVDVVGLDASRVHVVPPGVSAHRSEANGGELLRPSRPPRRLLFVGRDFHRKAGALTVEAVIRVRRDLPECTLTVIGPDRWPLRGAIPEGIDFRGRLPPAAVAQALHEHDLFVMPSWFEPFGIVFAEALTVGMPCIARDDFAAPEIIEHGRTGLLTRAANPDDLASVILSALNSETLFEATAAATGEARTRFSWSRAGMEIGDLLRSTVPAG